MKITPMPIYLALIAVVLAILTIAGCGKSKVDAAVEDHNKHVAQCRDELATKIPMIPIIGGGYLDVRRFAFNVPSVVYKDGECGTDMFIAHFYWTGEKILPVAEKFTGIPQGEIPKDWLRFRVGARLGNLRQARACEVHFDPKKCAKSEPVGYPATWPQERIVKPKNYPGLEIWLPPKRVKGANSITFVFTDWKHKNGRPRSMECFALDGYKAWEMTTEQLEDIDFGAHMYPCQVEYWDFTFKGGAARVHTGTEALHDITPALKALHQYISDSIIQED